ncbi:class I SAM-dependent methyltransferase [Pseudotenacibaculum sp. MALMAid0570]|uniref:class I SAM-dependent methyltransferase n=1 Tax=Pseudotenacibaculum sp. MALMAid0570 TaxID=3143938 RepID=UPI0032DEC383
MKTNQDLKSFYEAIYQKGEQSYFSKFENGANKSENDDIVMKNLSDVKGKTVLDIGCGTGELIYRIAKQGVSEAYGIDYSESAIKTAKEKPVVNNCHFSTTDFNDWDQPVDLIISCGTFEHMDEPWTMMKKVSNLLQTGGELILTCPHFYNFRGIVWISLQKLLGVPMSLTDVHSISPADMMKWGKEAGLNLEVVESYDYERANGKWMIQDMKKRLTNALRDAELANDNVDSLLNWFEDLIIYNNDNRITMDGANCLYKFVKN